MKLPFRLHSSPEARGPGPRGVFLPPAEPPFSLLQGVAQTGWQAPRTAARPDPEEGTVTPPASARPPLLADAERSLLALEGLRLRKPDGPENFHWGILGRRVQKVVTTSCSSPRGDGPGGLRGAAEEGRGVAAVTLLLMAGFSEGVSESFRKGSYLDSVCCGRSG